MKKANNQIVGGRGGGQISDLSVMLRNAIYSVHDHEVEMESDAERRRT